MTKINKVKRADFLKEFKVNLDEESQEKISRESSRTAQEMSKILMDNLTIYIDKKDHKEKLNICLISLSILIVYFLNNIITKEYFELKMSLLKDITECTKNMLNDIEGMNNNNVKKSH